MKTKRSRPVLESVGLSVFFLAMGIEMVPVFREALSGVRPYGSERLHVLLIALITSALPFVALHFALQGRSNGWAILCAVASSLTIVYILLMDLGQLAADIGECVGRSLC